MKNRKGATRRKREGARERRFESDLDNSRKERIGTDELLCEGKPCD